MFSATTVSSDIRSARLLQNRSSNIEDLRVDKRKLL
jgi:hypothetical protein